MNVNIYNYIYIYIYNILINFDMEFVDINFIKTHARKSTSPLKSKISISLAYLAYNIINFGTFFPFFLEESGRLLSGEHRLFVLKTFNHQCYRLFPTVKLKKNKRYNMILPIKVEAFEIGYDQKKIDIFLKYDIYDEKLFLKKYNKIRTLKNYGKIQILTNNERLKRVLFHLSGTVISYKIYKFYNDKNLDIISKHPIINCKSYYEKYKFKCLAQIKYEIFKKNNVEVVL